MTEESFDLHWPGSGLYPLKIVGTHFYRPNILRVAKNEPGSNALAFCTATLTPEKNNIHDENAVLVEIEKEKVGHLSREFAVAFRNQLAAQGFGEPLTTCDAVITAGIDTPERTYDYIIELDLVLTLTPTATPSRFPTVDRRDTSLLQDQGDGTYLIDVWLENGVRENMHKTQSIDSWTTDQWTTINYYAAHTKNCGIGHKLFAVQKNVHAKLFGENATIARFISLEGRHAVVELSKGPNNSFKPRSLRGRGVVR